MRIKRKRSARSASYDNTIYVVPYKEEEKEEGEGEEEEEAEEKVTVREKKNFCVCLYASSRVHSNHRLLLVYLFRPSLYHTIESERKNLLFE